MATLKEKMTLTRLQGIKNFLIAGKLFGDITPKTTVDELLLKVDEMMTEKNKGYQSKLRDMKDNGTEDSNFS